MQFLSDHRDQVFVPHQALKEFWANRQNVLYSVETEAEAAVRELSGFLTQASNKLNNWANRVGLTLEKRAELEEQLSGGFREVEIAIRDELPRMTVDLSHNTNEDSLLERLESILDDRVGPPLDTADHRKAVIEGIRRFEAKEPPGFGDKDKKGDARANDYIVWEQTLREAEVRRVPVVFVTDDSAKEDWYLVIRGQNRGALPALSAEMYRRAGALLVMVQTRRLAPGEERPAFPPPSHDNSRLDGRGGSDESAPNAEPAPTKRTSSETDGEVPVDDEKQAASDAVWTRRALDELLGRLGSKAPVQQQAIVAALQSGGFVDRQTVYELGGYERSRTLRGFTRPVSGVCAQLRAEGLLPENAPDALEAEYDSAFSYVLAAGFRVPESLAQLAE